VVSRIYSPQPRCLLIGDHTAHRALKAHTSQSVHRRPRPSGGWKVTKVGLWHPTSREKRARCGAPFGPLLGQSSSFRRPMYAWANIKRIVRIGGIA
jgi:hypothetical protein